MKIKSYWQTETGRWDDSSNSYKNRIMSDIKEKEIGVIIKTSSYDSSKEVLKFLGGPTGFEEYYIEDLLLNADNRFEKFYICAGTINSWSSCYVLWEDVKEILKENK